MNDKLENRLQRAFEYVRKTFFPRWDKEGQWVVRVDNALPSHGRCCRDIKTIKVKWFSEDDDFIRLLIHKICHAVAGEGHTRKWSDRYLKAAEKARELGHKELAQLCTEEAEAHFDPDKSERPTAVKVYTDIRDTVLEVKDISYERTIESVARNWGMYPEELEKKYKRCRKIYEEAIEDKKTFERARNIFRNKSKGERRESWQS